jgi:hypothetical protein
MQSTYVELQEIPVLRVKADMKGKGPSAAFDLLESKLPSLKGRKFYGTFQPKPDEEEYYACVARIDSDDPDKMKLERDLSPTTQKAINAPAASRSGPFHREEERDCRSNARLCSGNTRPPHWFLVAYGRLSRHQPRHSPD